MGWQKAFFATSDIDELEGACEHRFSKAQRELAGWRVASGSQPVAERTSAARLNDVGRAWFVTMKLAFFFEGLEFYHFFWILAPRVARSWTSDKRATG